VALVTRAVGLIAAALFVATVWAANFALTRWGSVPVGFGLEAPAGVYFAGLAFTLRDVVHRALGRSIVLACIAAGAALSWLVEANETIPGGVVPIAAASAIAFGLSELADLAVYEPVRRRGWLPAVISSNAIGIVVDSALFLWLAFGSLALIEGQLIGKAWMTLLALPLVWALRRTPGRLAVA
jgi:queuosine precursor transporter